MRKAKLDAALVHSNTKDPIFLGEGAWHDAWKVRKNSAVFVLRIPKETVYGQTVAYSEKTLQAEYGGTELYYCAVNKAVSGAAPEHYEFHVSPELTYTLETFAGKPIDLHAMPPETAFHIGQELGRIHRKTEDAAHDLSGFGYLDWTPETGLRGTFEGNAHKFLEEESKEQLADYEMLCITRPEFKNPIISEALQWAAELRQRRFTMPLLVNQDVSPENILVDGDRVRVIDPYPSIYYPRGMAGNFMNLYETLFIALADTERYRKHRFADCAGKLKMMAKGFLAGYSAGDPKIKSEVRGEQLLQLLESAYSHFCFMSEDISHGTKIRYGNKKKIAERFVLLSEELKALAIFQMDELSKLSIDKHL